MKRYIFIVLFIAIRLFAQNDQVPTMSDTTQVPDSNYHFFEYINSFEPDDFKEMLQKLIENQFDDFFSLRMAFTKSELYSPYDRSTSKRHARMRELMDDEKYSEALMIADSIFTKNFVDINTHLYCGYIYRKIGDDENSNLHYNIYDGLIHSIIASGDGKSPKTAFLVISTDEEYIILEHFQMQHLEQWLSHEGVYDFDVMRAKTQDGKEYEIYFNISLPYGELKKVFGGVKE